MDLLQAFGGGNSATECHHWSPSELAVAKPVVRLETPGPEVAMAIPALPVMRPMPPAMKAAFCSCRQTTVSIVESTSALKTASILAPGTPKTCVTPCISSVRTTSSAPICDLLKTLCIVLLLGQRFHGLNHIRRPR